MWIYKGIGTQGYWEIYKKGEKKGLWEERGALSCASMDPSEI